MPTAMEKAKEKLKAVLDAPSDHTGYVPRKFPARRAFFADNGIQQ